LGRFVARAGGGADGAAGQVQPDIAVGPGFLELAAAARPAADDHLLAAERDEIVAAAVVVGQLERLVGQPEVRIATTPRAGQLVDLRSLEAQGGPVRVTAGRLLPLGLEFSAERVGGQPEPLGGLVE